MEVCNRDCGLQSIRNQREGKLVGGHIGGHGNGPTVSPLPREQALSGLWSPPAATKVAA